MNDLTSRKAALRRTILAQRDALDPNCRAAASEHVAQSNMSALGPVSGLVVSGFWPIRSEIDPRPLMRRLEREGARLALPIVDHPRIRFLGWRFGDPLHPAGFGTLGPAADSPELEPDIVLTPLAAFDRTGARLGYGAGHYDRALRHLRALKPVRAIGIAFAMQEVDSVPTDATDQRLDGVLVDGGWRGLSRVLS